MNGFQYGLGGGGGVLRGDLYNGTTYTSPGNTTNVLDNKWHNVTLVYDGNTARIYVDGVSGSPLTGSGYVTTNNASLLIGNDQCCGGRFFNGLVDNARVYAKALTALEVRNLYAEEKKSYEFAKK